MPSTLIPSHSTLIYLSEPSIQASWLHQEDRLHVNNEGSILSKLEKKHVNFPFTPQPHGDPIYPLSDIPKVAQQAPCLVNL